MAFTSATITVGTITVTETSVTVAYSARIVYTNGSYGAFNVYINDASSVNHGSGSIAAYSGTGTARTVTGSVTWSGLTASTTYYSNDVRMVGPSSGTTFATSNTFNFTTSAPATYTITWNPNSGSVSPTSSSGTNGSTGTSPTPTRDGYTFTGWYTAVTGGTLKYSPGGTYTIAASNVTYYARWVLTPPSAPTYLTATYNSYTDKIDLSFGGSSGTITAFHIWYSGSASGTPSAGDSPDYTVTTTNSYGSYSNTGLEPSTERWYWVRAANSGGTSAWYPSADGVAGRTSDPPPPAVYAYPTISGTGTSGESLSATSGSYQSGATVSKSIAYSTSSSFSGAPNSTQSSPYTVTNTDATNAPFYFAAVDTVTFNGYTFYYYSYPILSNFKITLNPNYSGATSSSTTYVATASQSAIYLGYVYRSGYTFNGWFTATAGGTRVDDSNTYYTPSGTSNITLYAQWTAYPVSKNYGPSLSGTGVTGTQFSASSGNYNYASSAGVTTRVGYNTSGSFPDNENQTSQGNPYTVTDGDASYVPFYFAAKDTVYDLDGNPYYFYSSPVISKLKVSFNAGGGTPTPDSISYIAASPANSITLPATSRTGYTFNGWYIDSNLTDLAGATGQPYTSYTPSTTVSTTLYAGWTVTPQSRYYFVSEGSDYLSYADSTLYYDGTTIYLPYSTKSGYTFGGWWTQPNSGGSFVGPAGGSFTVGNPSYTSGQTFYAYWYPTEYTLTYNANGGTVSPTSKVIAYNSTYGTLPTPTRSGYSFNGWFTASTGGTPVVSTTNYATPANSTIFAQWTAQIPVFSDQQITTTATLNKDINTNIDYTVSAAPVTSFSIVYSGTGLNPTSWLTISKESGTNNGILAGKPTQVGTYTFIVRATNSGGGDTDSSLITLVVSPAGKRFKDSGVERLSVAKRFDGSAWVGLKVMRRFDGTAWQDIGNI